MGQSEAMSSMSSSSLLPELRALRRWASNRCWLVAASSLLLALSLSGKILHYAKLESGAQAMPEARLRALLQPLGWQEIGTVALTLAGDYRTLLWSGPAACAETVEISAFSSDGEAAGLIDARVAPDQTLFFVHAGRTFREMPSFAFLRDKFTVAMEAAGVPGFRASPYLAVIAPAACPIERAVPWDRL